ncbi:sigma-70 family RNA polymerase sigma factor [Cellulosimicrobium arenosum]|uniref:Sigma-70 family RNA polymerase sigma factor n=1 Tax=Cellulosimicrobium arenosum TaxID=2708133 RepID=A0A927G646_9MICO|nr:sigma-70 family RNA polymerase sigma factor [Cellulosimicrobium arenosum]MBD8077638.1 sigma-70 family RNA polymerase sigma factor [Cellulosimicrobium arenosum]
MSVPTVEMMSPAATTGVRCGRVGPDAGLEIFLSQRALLGRIACRILGDATGAEDVVQEVWLRWQRTDRSAIENPAAFLTTTTTRMAINVVRSARHRHEAPGAAPSSEPADPAQDPTLRAEREESVSRGLAHLMARLSPRELAAYLLRKGFEYPCLDVAVLLGTSAANVRQLVRRAQVKIRGDRPSAVDPAAHRLLVHAFSTAAATGDLEALEQVLVPRIRLAPVRTLASTGPASPRPGRQVPARAA